MCTYVGGNQAMQHDVTIQYKLQAELDMQL
jgi:hypothetical protein